MTTWKTLCTTYVDVLQTWGHWFIVAAFFAALLLVLTEAWARVMVPAAPEARDGPPGTGLTAITALIKALSVVQVWLAMAFIGGGMMYLSITQIPEACATALGG